MAKKRRPQATDRGRLSWDGRLWDPDGVEYARADPELARADAARLCREPAVQIVISMCAGPLRWIAVDDRARVWRSEVDPNFHDQPGWKPPPSAPGQLPFHAELWANDQRRVLLITDRD